MGIGEFKPGFDLSKMNDPVKNNVGVKDLVNVSMNYYLRVFTSGCYFFEDQQEEWKGQGMSVGPGGSGGERPVLLLGFLGMFLVVFLGDTLECFFHYFFFLMVCMCDIDFIQDS